MVRQSPPSANTEVEDPGDPVGVERLTPRMTTIIRYWLHDNYTTMQATATTLHEYFIGTLVMVGKEDQSELEMILEDQPKE